MNHMTYNQQRRMASELFPQLEPVIWEHGNCFKQIIAEAQKHRREILFRWEPDWPQEWIYWWVCYAGDLDRLIDHLTSSEWAMKIHQVLYSRGKLTVEMQKALSARVTTTFHAREWVRRNGGAELFHDRFPVHLFDVPGASF